jgi:YesN/AraC family two-component response regulator
VSSTSDARLLRSTVKLGASDFMLKPFDENDVRAVLGRLRLVPSPEAARGEPPSGA